MFCLSCGSFIAIGSKAKASPSALPFSGPPPVPGDADEDVSLPFVEGVAPLGSYSLEAQRRATRRTRTMTAVISVAMAMVIGGAALYLASPLSDRGSVPQTAAVVIAPAPTEQTAAVSGISIEPQAAPAGGATTTDLEPVLAAEPIAQPEPVVAAEPIAQPEPVVAAEPIAQPEPMVEAEPIAELPPVVTVEPESEPAQPEPMEPVTEPVAQPTVVGAVEAQPMPEPETEEIVEPAEPALRQVGDTPEVYSGGWVCGGDGEVSIDDSRIREWSLGRVSFRVRPGFERVVLHLERAGQGGHAPPSVTAEAVPTSQVRSILPGVSRPSSGKTTIGLKLDDGFAGNLALRGYDPSGLATIKEFSVYHSGRDGKSVLISAEQDACYRVRVPAWNDTSNSVRRAEIHIDIKP